MKHNVFWHMSCGFYIISNFQYLYTNPTNILYFCCTCDAFNCVDNENLWIDILQKICTIRDHPFNYLTVYSDHIITNIVGFSKVLYSKIITFHLHRQSITPTYTFVNTYSVKLIFPALFQWWYWIAAICVY